MTLFPKVYREKLSRAGITVETKPLNWFLFWSCVGCSFLILNVFVFALVYYRRDKRRAQELKNSQSADSEGSGKYSEPPELLKSNSTTGSSIHIQPNCSQTTTGGTGVDSYGIHSCGSGPSPISSQHHRGILLSPQQAHMNHHQTQHHYTSASQLLGIGTLPRTNGGIGIGHSMSSLPKPPPPPRGVSNFATLPHKGGHVCHSQIPGSSSSQKLTQFEELNVWTVDENIRSSIPSYTIPLCLRKSYTGCQRFLQIPPLLSSSVSMHVQYFLFF